MPRHDQRRQIEALPLRLRKGSLALGGAKVGAPRQKPEELAVQRANQRRSIVGVEIQDPVVARGERQPAKACRKKLTFSRALLSSAAVASPIA